jgi:transcriptional regulator
MEAKERVIQYLSEDFNQRTIKAMNLRASGKTWSEIGTELKVTKQQARDIFLKGEKHLERKTKHVRNYY